jgi:glucoamylase
MANKGFERSSAGYVGVSDGWHDFNENGQMTYTYDVAEHGNVALMAELSANEGVLALGFATSNEGANTRTRSSLAEGFESVSKRFIAGWKAWGKSLNLPKISPELEREAYVSAMVLKVHEDKSYPGAVVASLSIPWGSAHDDLGGYHLVWARDAVEAGLGLLAAGQFEDAQRMLSYLIATQTPDGRWPQNMFPDGRPFWTGIQLDEIGFPVLLAAKLRELDALGEIQGVETMARAAVAYLIQHGPVSPQDRWEENAGSSPFTLAVEVAALVAGSSFLNKNDAAYALSVADYWNEQIEAWTYAQAGDWAAEAKVDGYYVRIAPSLVEGGLRGCIEVRNRPHETLNADALISMDFLYLSRLGLRQANDPKMLNTLKVADLLLKVDTPNGLSYHRYNQDGYGEHSDGSPFDGTGIGRAWPLLTGERGHFALQQGEDPIPYLKAMTKMSGRGGLIPEQVWDTDALPEKFLFPGHPSGSAMPLVWAHAEFLKLLYALKAGEPLELLDILKKRYAFKRPDAKTWHWQNATPFASLPKGKNLNIEAAEPFTLFYQFDSAASQEQEAVELGLGMYGLSFKHTEMSQHTKLSFEQRFKSGDATQQTLSLK